MTPEIIAYIDRSGNLRPSDCPVRSDLEPLVRLSDVLALLKAVPVGEAQDRDMGAFDALKEQA